MKLSYVYLSSLSTSSFFLLVVFVCFSLFSLPKSSSYFIGITSSLNSSSSCLLSFPEFFVSAYSSYGEERAWKGKGERVDKRDKEGSKKNDANSEGIGNIRQNMMNNFKIFMLTVNKYMSKFNGNNFFSLLFSFFSPSTVIPKTKDVDVEEGRRKEELMQKEEKEEKIQTKMGGGNGNRMKCLKNTGGTCVVFSCSKWRGPTDCIKGECLCYPGYCRNAKGSCRGCEHFSLEVRGVPQQQNKAGMYGAISGFAFSYRPVWKQVNSNNWIWFCPLYGCWIISDISPNANNCEAGIVSPQSPNSKTPFEVAGAWKYWNGAKWMDDINREHLVMRCQDSSSFDSSHTTSPVEFPTFSPFRAAGSPPSSSPFNTNASSSLLFSSSVFEEIVA